MINHYHATRIPANFWMHHQRAKDKYVAENKDKKESSMLTPPRGDFYLDISFVSQPSMINFGRHDTTAQSMEGG